MPLVPCVLLVNVNLGRTSQGNGNSTEKTRKKKTVGPERFIPCTQITQSILSKNVPSQQLSKNTYPPSVSWTEDDHNNLIKKFKMPLSYWRSPESRRTRKVASHNAPPSSLDCLIFAHWSLLRLIWDALLGLSSCRKVVSLQVEWFKN